MDTSIVGKDPLSQVNQAVASFYEMDLSITVDPEHCFELDSRASKSLDIVPDPKLRTNRKCDSIYSILNQCRTLCGQKLLMYWIRRPLKDKVRIEKRQNIIQHLITESGLRQSCHENFLRKMPDLLKIANNFAKQKATLTDMVKVDRARTVMISVIERLEENCDNLSKNVQDLLTAMKTCVGNLETFAEFVNTTIDVDKLDPNGNFMIKADFDEDISRISIEISAIEAKAKSILKNTARDLDLEYDKSIKLETDLSVGFGLKVTRKQEQSLRGKEDKYHPLANAKKDGVRFTCKELSRLSDDYINLHKEYKKAAEEITLQILETAAEHKEPIKSLGVMVAILDVFVSLAVVSFQNDYVRPEILEKGTGIIMIEKMRHPCLENQPDIENFVANNIELNKDKKKFFVITGPNMGGKSTYIKSVAVCVLMSQIGCYVPATEAQVSIVDGILTRIGAGDRQLQGISTFMDEMLDMAEILKKATSDSLVIIDELGRGTSTFEGFGLAWSISERLAKEINSYTLFATHFHELTELENEIESVGNLNILAHCDEDKLVMLYSVEPGVCKESYGINVAKYTNFPDHVVGAAQEKLQQFEEIAGFKTKEDVRGCVKKIAKMYQEKQVSEKVN